MKTVTIERWNTHTLYHSVKGIIPKIKNIIIVYNNRIPHYEATRKNDNEQTFT